MTDRNRLLKTLAGCFAYYERELSDVAVSVWLSDLAGHSPDAIDAAFIRHRRDPQRGQFLPRTADILRHLQADANERRQTAWAGVLSEARRVGNYGSPSLTDEQQAAVDAIGGWRAVCHCDERELGFMQRRFMEAFDAFSARTDRDQALIESTASAAIAAIARKVLQ